MKIDFHSHYYPEEYLRYLEKKDPKKKDPNETPRRKQRGIITDLLFYSSSQATGNLTLRD